MAKYARGNLVNFTGKKYYTSMKNNIYRSCQPGIAEIVSIADASNPHPYQLAGASGVDGASTVKGWVAEEDISGLFVSAASNVKSYADSKTVMIGHARGDEEGKAKGGEAGDQTGKEVCIQKWYNKPWTMIFRAKDTSVAEKLASTMEAACANDNIGYDQAQRTTLYTQAEKVKFDLTKINTPCECDCSALVAVCVNAAGIKVSKSMYTGSEEKTLLATGKFLRYNGTGYQTKSDYLRRGDILLGNGHTAICLTNGPKSGEVSGDTPVTPAPEPEKPVITGDGIGKAVSKGSMRIRKAATTKAATIAIVHKGDELEVYEITSDNWYKVAWKNGFGYTSNRNNLFYKYTPYEKEEEAITPAPAAEPEEENIVVPNKPSRVSSLKAAKSKDKSLNGSYELIENGSLYHGPSTSYEKMVDLPEGSKVRCYGYYTEVNNIKWLYVQITYNKVTYTGFCPEEILEEV